MALDPTFGWLDDRTVATSELCLPADDPGLLRGDGIFETMRVRAGTVVALAAHLARFEAARRALALPEPAVAPAEAIARTLAANAPLAPELGLRLTLSARPTLLIRLRPLEPRDLARRAGLELYTLPTRRADHPLARVKSLAHGASPLAQRLHPEGARPGFEGLWLDPRGLVLEGTSTNVFAVFGEVCLTPPLTLPILPGVSRARVLAALARLGLPFEERRFDRARLQAADEIFATNAILPLVPVLALDGRTRVHVKRPLVARLAAALADDAS